MPAAPPKRSPIDHAPSRRAGERAEKQVFEDHFARWFALVGASAVLVPVAVFAWAGHLFGFQGVHWPLTAAAVFFLAVTTYTIRGDWNRVRRQLLGAKGERAVADVLDQLRRERGYHVLHDIPIYKGGQRTPSTPDEQPVANIDHVLIGPAGVLVIETKTLSKPSGRKAVVRFDGERLLVDGRPLDRDPIAQARRNIADVRAMIQGALGGPTPVRPVVLFPGWWVEDSSKGRGEVWVMNPKQLFGRLPVGGVTTKEEAGRIAASLRR